MTPFAIYLHRRRRLARIVLEVRHGQVHCLDIEFDGFRRESLIDAKRWERFVSRAEAR